MGWKVKRTKRRGGRLAPLAQRRSPLRHLARVERKDVRAYRRMLDAEPVEPEVITPEQMAERSTESGLPPW